MLKGISALILLSAGVLSVFGQSGTRRPQTQQPTQSQTPTKSQTKEVPIIFPDDPHHAVVFMGKWQAFDGGASGDLTWIRCEFLTMECTEIDAYVLSAPTGASKPPHSTQAPAIWETDFNIKNLQGSSMLAEGYSVDGCTRYLLIANFQEKSLHRVLSPVMPMSVRCKNANAAFDKLFGKKGETLKDQTEQDILVPTQFFGRGDPEISSPDTQPKQ